MTCSVLEPPWLRHKMKEWSRNCYVCVVVFMSLTINPIKPFIRSSAWCMLMTMFWFNPMASFNSIMVTMTTKCTTAMFAFFLKLQLHKKQYSFFLIYKQLTDQCQWQGKMTQLLIFLFIFISNSKPKHCTNE